MQVRLTSQEMRELVNQAQVEKLEQVLKTLHQIQHELGSQMGRVSALEEQIATVRNFGKFPTER